MKEERTFRTAAALMFITAAGKVLGLIRDRLLARTYGTGMQANAFYTARAIPRLLLDGLLSSAIALCFVPAFSRRLAGQGRQGAFAFGRGFLARAAGIGLLMSVGGACFAPELVELFAGGYDEQTAALAARLTRIMMPCVLLGGVTFTLAGMLQSLGQFRIPALIGAVSNLVVLGWFFIPGRPGGICGLAAAFVLGWAAQVVVQLPALERAGWRWRGWTERRGTLLGQTGRLLPAALLSAWVEPVGMAVRSAFASRLYQGAGVSALERANDLYLILTGVAALSVTNVIGPRLARYSARGEEAAFRGTVWAGVKGLLLLLTPASLVLAALARPLVTILYGGGAFDARAIDRTARCLRWLALGMAGYGTGQVGVRAWFARQEGRVPAAAGLAALGVNGVLCAVLIRPMGLDGLALASSASATVHALLLLLPLRRAGRGEEG